MNTEKAQEIMTEALQRLTDEAGMEFAQAMHIRLHSGEMAMLVAFGSRTAVEQTINKFDPPPVRFGASRLVPVK